MIDAVVFDLDGVIIDSEELWNEVREALAHERGGRWSAQAQADMMGMSSTEWSRYLHDVVGLPEPPEEINREVVDRMLARYSERLLARRQNAELGARSQDDLNEPSTGVDQVLAAVQNEKHPPLAQVSRERVDERFPCAFADLQHRGNGLG